MNSEIQLKSINYSSEKNHKFKLDLRITMIEQPKEIEDPESSNDTLVIKFKNKNKIPDDVQQYVEQNLGMYELVENEDQKILLFELKLNNIKYQEIHQHYKQYFKDKVKDLDVHLKIQKNDSLYDMALKMDENHQFPFYCHFFDSSLVDLQAKGMHQFLITFDEYLKLQKLDYGLYFDIIKQFRNIKGKLEVDYLNNSSQALLGELNFDQRGLYQEATLGFDNVLNSYIFDGTADDQYMEIEGEIMGIVKYSLKVHSQEYLDFIKEMKKIN